MECECYRELDLSSAASAYIESRLEMGDVIGKLARRDLDLGSGSVIAFLPDEVNAAEASESFTGGGVASPSCTLDWVVTCLQEHLRRSPSSAVLVADSVRISGDNFFACDGGRVLTCHDEVFCLFTGGVADRHAIAWAIDCAHQQFLLLAYMLSKCELEPASAEPTELSADQIQALSDAIEGIVIGAFDGEGFLIWSKQRRAPRTGSITYVETEEGFHDGLDGAQRVKDTLFGHED